MMIIDWAWVRCVWKDEEGEFEEFVMLIKVQGSDSALRDVLEINLSINSSGHSL